MRLLRIVLLVLIALSNMSCGGTKLRFLICPNEYSSRMKMDVELSVQREILFDTDYLVMIVTKNGKAIEPVQHYRPEHTFTDKLHSIDVTYSNPLHISSIIIVDIPKEKCAIAIKKKDDKQWRIYWLSKKDINAINNGMIFLPPFEKLTLLHN